jgi:protein TonB
VLAAFAPTPHAFTITHVAVLKTMGDQISTLLQKERRAREENPQAQAEAPRPAAPVIPAKPVIAATPAPVVPAVVIKPSTPQRAAAPVVSKVEPVKSMPVEVVPLATPPKKEEKRSEFAPRANFGTLDSVAAEEKKPANRSMMIGVAAVLVIAAGATFGFLKLQKSGSSAPHQQTQEAANLPPAQPAAGASGTQPVPNGNTAAGPSATTAPAPAAAKPAAEIDARKAAKAAAEKTSNAPAEKPAPAERPAAVATLGASGPSKISQQASAQPASDVAPSFTVVSGNTPPALSNLARPVATSTPSAAAIEQSQLEPLQLIRGAAPVYPAIAKARSITGTVVVQGTVGKDGRVSPSSLQFISGPPVFKDAAFEALRQYQFKPARLNGQPIEQVTQIKLVFK